MSSSTGRISANSTATAPRSLAPFRWNTFIGSMPPPARVSRLLRHLPDRARAPPPPAPPPVGPPPAVPRLPRRGPPPRSAPPLLVREASAFTEGGGLAHD